MNIILTLLFLFVTSCTHPSSPTPSPPTSKPVPAPPPTVEQQLLATVKRAEDLGPGNPLLLSSLYSLAAYYQDQKEYSKAATQFQRILELKEKQVGPNHPDIASILNRYAQILHQANRHSEADRLAARAVAILEQSSALSSPQ